MMLSEQKDKDGKLRKLLTHPDRNGIVYTLDLYRRHAGLRRQDR